jgi:polyisoprenoid-binding protein YceI
MTPARHRRTALIVGVAVALLAVAAAGAWWFLGRDTPDEVDLDTAAGGVDRPGTTADSAGSAPVDLDGSWTVDTSTGEFDFDRATGTFAGFRIDEELAGLGATEAVGRTGEVSGSFRIEGTTVTAASFDVQLTSLATNDSRRDRRVQQALETDRFPTASFRLIEPIELGAEALRGADVSVTAAGELTLHGVTRPVRVPLQARLVDDTVVVVGSFEVAFSDYGVEVPSAPVVLSVSDTGTVEVQLLLRR